MREIVLLVLVVTLVTPSLAATGDAPAREAGPLRGEAALGPAEGGWHADPGRSASFALFPDHETVQASLEAAGEHPWVTLHAVGTSVEGRPIVLAELTDPESPVPIEERVVTFVFTQQHGNEPAGTPAALAVLDEITAGGPLAELLSNQVLLLLPMANPDGALEQERHNAQDLDINRDHIALDTPEARALHHVLNTWDVHVAMDHHEYGGIGLGEPVPVRLYDYDLTTLFPVHGNVASAIDDAARLLMYEGIWPAAEAAGFTANEYGEVTVAGVPVQQLAGGPDPGIERNHLGLHHIAGLLVETRVDAIENPFHDAERRVAIHRAVMDATLAYAHENAAMFRAAKAAATADTLAFPDTVYREGEDRVAPLADGLVVPGEPGVADVLAWHGLPLGTTHDDGTLFDLRHELRGHAAAALHPASSRALVDGARGVDLDDAGEALQGTSAGDAASIPTVGPLALLAVLASLALAGARRRRG